METHADVNFFNRNASNSSGVTTQNTNMAVPTENKVVARPRPVYRRSDSSYDMSGDKYALIFNHKTYKHTPYFKARPSKRDGTDEDVEKLCATLGCRGYSVSVRDNLDHAEIMADVQMLCNSDHRNTSLVSIFILTHGMSGGIVYAADRPYSLESIMTLLQNGNEYLVGKPKLLFVQVTTPKFSTRYSEISGVFKKCFTPLVEASLSCVLQAPGDNKIATPAAG